MAYVRHKVIKGHVYYYLVEGRREGKRVRQRVLKYLGKYGTLSGSNGVVYRGLPKPDPDEDGHSIEVRQRARFVKAFKSLGFIVRHNLSGRTTTKGRVIIVKNQAGEIIRRSVSLTKQPTISTMSHELGHAIDYYLQEKNGSFWTSKTFNKNQKAIRIDFMNAGKESYRSNLERDPSLEHGPFFQNYVFTDVEGFANAFELFLTDYKKAMRVVPNMVPVFHDITREDNEIRKLIETLDVWELDDDAPKLGGTASR